MQAFQTAGPPPRRGSIILASSGWMENVSVAATNTAAAKRMRPATGAGPTLSRWTARPEEMRDRFFKACWSRKRSSYSLDEPLSAPQR